MIGKEVENVLGQGLDFGVSAVAFGGGLEAFGHGVSGLDGVVDDRIEVDKPAFEQGLGDLLQGAVHLSVEFDFVVQGAEDMGDGALIRSRRPYNWYFC